MKFTNNQIDLLRAEMKKRLSNKRFIHTLGVERMAVIIGEKCLPNEVDSLRIAALLHDISKEYSEEEHLTLLERYNVKLDDGEYDQTPLWHSVTAPLAVREHFSSFATEQILSAVRHHTVGCPGMNTFDEIILLSDYIEEGRTYEKCVKLRESFLRELSNTEEADQCIVLLHSAVVKSLDNNIQEFVSRGKAFHERTLLTRDAISNKIEGKNNGRN